MAPSIMFANFKGGCGKTTLSHHLSVRAAERGARVLSIDCDRQGDLYRRLVGDDGDLADMPPTSWGTGSNVVHSPEGWSVPPSVKADLVVIDTGPALGLPQGPVPSMVIVPVDGVDAARNANETVAECLERGVAAVVIVMVGVEEVGVKQARRFDEMKASLPPKVEVLDLRIPRGGSIKRTALTCRPAWSDVWKGKDALAIRAFANQILDRLGAPNK
jgi:Mrp family chromosome partitioning ATPase